MTLDQKGGYSLQALESATVVSLDDDSTVLNVSALTTDKVVVDGNSDLEELTIDSQLLLVKQLLKKVQLQLTIMSL